MKTSETQNAVKDVEPQTENKNEDRGGEESCNKYVVGAMKKLISNYLPPLQREALSELIAWLPKCERDRLEERLEQEITDSLLNDWWIKFSLEEKWDLLQKMKADPRYCIEDAEVIEDRDTEASEGENIDHIVAAIKECLQFYAPWFQRDVLRCVAKGEPVDSADEAKDDKEYKIKGINELLKPYSDQVRQEAIEAYLQDVMPGLEAERAKDDAHQEALDEFVSFVDGKTTEGIKALTAKLSLTEQDIEDRDTEAYVAENEAEGANVKSGSTVSEGSAEDVEFPSTGIPRLDTFIGEALDDACVIAYVCFELARQNKELGDKIYAVLKGLAEPFRQGRFKKAHDLELEIYPMTKWMSLLDGYEAGLTSAQNKRTESDTVKTLYDPEKLLDFVNVVADDAAAMCLACLDIQKVNSQLAGEIRGKLWERVRPIIEDGQIPSDMDKDVAADMMRLLGIRDAILALAN